MDLREETVMEMAENLELELKQASEMGSAARYMITDPRFHTIVVGDTYDLTLEDAASWLEDLKTTQSLLKRHKA